jgi:opacity protein-like surface antigen
MYRHVTASLIVLALVPLTASKALAQDRLDLSSALEINVHGGAAFLDELESNELFGGATALLHVGSGIALGGTVDWVGTTIDEDEDDDEEGLDATLWYYSAELAYGFPTVTQAQFYGLIGAGVARFQPGSDLEDAGVEDESNVMVPVGVGVRWLNSKDDPSWGATFDIRDRIVYSDDEETKVSNDWSVAFGLSLLLGG